MMVSVVANSAQAWEKIGTGIIRETVIEVMDTVSVLDGTAINKTIVMAATPYCNGYAYGEARYNQDTTTRSKRTV